MERDTLTNYCAVQAGTGDELCTGVGCCCAFPSTQVDDRADRAQCVGERHVSPSMQDATGGTQIGAYIHFGKYSIRLDQGEANTHEAREQRVEKCLKRNEIEHESS